jgi:hypothetical protein
MSPDLEEKGDHQEDLEEKGDHQEEHGTQPIEQEEEEGGGVSHHVTGSRGERGPPRGTWHTTDRARGGGSPGGARGAPSEAGAVARAGSAPWPRQACAMTACCCRFRRRRRLPKLEDPSPSLENTVD